ncbi:MAG: hypothetical protein WCE81_03210 [Halobacteriota archaeon]
MALDVNPTILKRHSGVGLVENVKKSTKRAGVKRPANLPLT